MTMKNIGVFGTCVSRDIFNSQIVPDYKDHFKITFGYTRDHITSVMQNPVEFNESDVKLYPENKQNRIREKEILQILRKDFFEDLSKSNIDYLLFDNIHNTRWPIIKYQDTYFVKHIDIARTEFFKNLEDYEVINLKHETKEYLKLYKDACNKFFKRMEEEYPEIRIILNPARDSCKKYDEDNKTKIVHKYSLKQDNQFLPLFDGYILKNFDVEVLDFNNNIYINPDHLWGANSTHYSPDYYTTRKDEILNIIERNEKLSNYDLQLNKKIVYDNRNRMYHKTYMEAKAYIYQYQHTHKKNVSDKILKKRLELIEEEYDIRNPIKCFDDIRPLENSDKEAVQIILRCEKTEVELNEKIELIASVIDSNNEAVPYSKVALKIKTDNNEKMYEYKTTDRNGQRHIFFTLAQYNEKPIEFTCFYKGNNKYAKAKSNTVKIYID